MFRLDFPDLPLEIIRITIGQWSGHYFLDHRNEVMERTHRREWCGARGAETSTGGSQKKSFLDNTKRRSSIMQFQGQTSVFTTHAAQSPRRMAIKFKKLINVWLGA
jgi:hypothetical protein